MSSVSTLVEESGNNAYFDNEQHKEKINFLNRARSTRRRRGDDGNELTPKSCWRE